jgi:hypothetical protein
MSPSQMATAGVQHATRSLTYRPWRVWVNEISTTLVWSATVGVIAALALGSPWGYLTAALAVAVSLLSVPRALRIGLVVTETTVSIDNYWTTHVILWADVDGVGIGSKGLLPRPALLFQLRNQAPVLAMATPARRQERQDLQTAVLALAPASVRRLEDAPARAGIVGADWALSNRLRLWWLGKPLRPDPKAAEQVWPEQPFGFSLLFVIVGLVATALALVLGVSVLVGSIKSGAPASHYLVAFLLLLGASLGCLGLQMLRKRIARRRRAA